MLTYKEGHRSERVNYNKSMSTPRKQTAVSLICLTLVRPVPHIFGILFLLAHLKYHILNMLKVTYHPLYSMNKFVTYKSKLPQDGAQVFPYMG